MSNERRERDTAIDICKGIGIISVIIGHCFVLPDILQRLVYSFHMPLFFILSGYFLKPSNNISIWGGQKDIRRLILPYLIFSCIGLLKFTISDIVSDNYEMIPIRFLTLLYASGHNNYDFPAVGIIWFLPALYWCKNFLKLILSTRHSNCITTVVCVLVSFIAIYVGKNVIDLPFGILMGLSAIQFSYFGYWLRLHKNNNVLLFLPLYLVWIVCVLFSNMSMCFYKYDLFPLDIIGAIGGSLFVMYLSKYLDNHSCAISKVLCWFGRNSMVILCMHYLGSLLDINQRFGIRDWWAWLFIDFSLVLLLTVISTRFVLTKRLFNIR